MIIDVKQKNEDLLDWLTTHGQQGMKKDEEMLGIGYILAVKDD